jgi:hypothetical protein
MTSAIRYLSLLVAMLATAAVLTLDDTVGRNINDFSSQQNAGDATGLFHRLIIADIQARMADPNHAYSWYAGYSRATHDR